MSARHFEEVTPSRSAATSILAGFVSSLTAALITGCATVQTKPKADANLTEYRKVYVQTVEEGQDPRHVFPKVLNRLHQIGFDVQVVDKDHPLLAQGSGFVVDEQGHVLTCAHVLGAKTTNATAQVAGRRFEADVVLSDTNHDLALLKLRSVTNALLPLRFATDTNLAMGQDVFTLGFPLSDVLGSTPRLTKGLVSSTVGMDDNPDQVQVSAEVQAGNSGGPLLNSRSEVIGVVTGTLNPMKVLASTSGTLPQNVNFAVKGIVVLTFLSKAGLDAAMPAENSTPMTFDQAKDSVAIVRAGIVPPDAAKAKEMLCVVKYVYFWDMWWRFRVFHVEFHDLKKGDLLLKAGQYRDTVFTSEDAVIDRVFEEIRASFFPGQPKPPVQPAASPNLRK